ncbi:MAG TPA: lipocalin-like domain-containing protein [Thermoanaerobaculia bacterium]
MSMKSYGPIIGCWQMTEAWDIDDPGKPGKSYPWGNPPLGYWVYDPAGNFALQISVNPPLPLVNVPAPDPNANWWDVGQSLTSDMTASFDNYYAYFGTYTVDYEKGVVTHHVITDVLRAYTGTKQPRDFKLSDDNNELTIGDPASYIRKFKRVASFGPY